MLQAIKETAAENEIITEPLDCENNRKFDLGPIIIQQIRKVSYKIVIVY